MGLNDFKLEETQESGVPLCEVFNSQRFPGLFTYKNNFFQVKMYSGLFLTVRYNLMYGKIAKASIILVLFFKFQEFSRTSKVLLFLRHF